jgi:hypothetical protein
MQMQTQARTQQTQTRTSDWQIAFRALYDKAVQAYDEGQRDLDRYFSPQEIAMLESIGCTPQELYDFAEDWCQMNEPAFETALAITALRRTYLLEDQQGRRSRAVLDSNALPPREAELAGMAWLPRILCKARAKLRGELPPDVMYACAGDRRFLRSVGIDAASFLALVRAAGDDDAAVVREVLRRSGRTGPQLAEAGDVTGQV